MVNCLPNVGMQDVTFDIKKVCRDRHVCVCVCDMGSQVSDLTEEMQ